MDIRALPLSPAEAFVLSRVDGMSTVAEIAEQTGTSNEGVQALLERLAALGAVSFDEPPVSQQRRAGPSPAAVSAVIARAPMVETRMPSDLHHPAASLFDPRELDEAVDIELPRKRQILELYYRIDQLSHYQLFGIEPSADKKAIKAAYFDVVNVFHPDRYFGKNVGSFKPKLEKVFARLTQAYDVLSRSASRAEYDAYLQAQSKTLAFDAGQADSAAHRAALQEVMRRIQAEASAESTRLSTPPHPHAAPLEPSPASSGGGRPSPSPGLRPSATLRPSDPESRRRALARKLGRTSNPELSFKALDAEAEQMSAAAEDAQRKEWAADELKRRYQERMHAARDRQVDAYKRAAKEALDKGDNVGAANALRIAVSLSPDDAVLAQQLNEVAAKARLELSGSYLQQAEYEEREEKWLAAARSYGRALTGRPEAQVFDKVAHCLLSGDGDPREASEMAKKAVMLRPDSAQFRVTLARCYLKAGLKKSAEGELSRAATLAPTDDKVMDWIRRLQRELG